MEILQRLFKEKILPLLIVGNLGEHTFFPELLYCFQFHVDTLGKIRNPQYSSVVFRLQIRNSKNPGSPDSQTP